MSVEAVPQPIHEPDESLVKDLEEGLVSEAKSGRIAGLFVVAELTDGTMRTMISARAPGNAYKVIGAVEKLKLEAFKRWLYDGDDA